MWTAVFLALVHGAIFALYGAWAVANVAAGAAVWPFVVSLPLVLLALPFAVVLIAFGVAWWFRADRPADVCLDARGTLGLVCRELAAVAGNAPRMILYRWLIREPAPAPAAAPILLIHGVLCNAGVWHPFKRWLERRRIGPVYTLSYVPPLASIELFAEQAAGKIDEILAVTGASRVVVVTHSMGGLVMRAYLRRHGGRKVARLVTIGAPHQGSMHAWLAPGESLSQMRPGNAWLADLGLPAGEGLPPVVSLWSWHDSMVAPQTSSRIVFGDNIVIAGVGHNALLYDRDVFERVLSEIRKAG